MKLDLHVHTWRSADSRSAYDEIIARAAEKGLDALAITDHNTIVGAREMAERSPIPIIMGEEIRTPEGEIIGLFLREEVPRGLSPEETIARIKEQGGLVVVPHPFDRIRRGSALGEAVLRRVIEQVDIIEGFNARVIFSGDNTQARAVAAKHGLPCSAGSDAHAPYEIGAAYVEMAPWSTPAEFLANLREARITGHLSSPRVRLSSTWAKMVRWWSGSLTREKKL
jgi:hypothetical protein